MLVMLNFSDNLGHHDGPVIFPFKQASGSFAQAQAVLWILDEPLDYLLELADISFGYDVATLFLKNRGRDAVLFTPQKHHRPAHRQYSGELAGNDQSLDPRVQGNQVDIPGGQGFPEPFPGLIGQHHNIFQVMSPTEGVNLRLFRSIADKDEVDCIDPRQ